jgi:DNA polymerase-3 subunit gamma/tau
MSWHLENRPKEFKDMIGNKGIKEAVPKILEKEDSPHSYLLYGPHGSGKTSTAYIIANKLTEDRYIHYINCSSDNGIDTARKIIEKASKKKLTKDNIVYILDEVHKLTNAFQNGILNILEEPPEDTYFILCTTELQKLLKTVKSRCIIYKTELPKKPEIKRFLVKLAKKYDKECSNEVINAIIEQNECIPRDCITSLESVIDIEDEEKQLELIRNDDSTTQAIDLCRVLMYSPTWKKIQNVLNNITEDPESIRYVILGYMSTTMLNMKTDMKAINKAALIMDCFRDNYYNTKKAGLIMSCYEYFSSLGG